jgi:RNA polymerase sigma-70 factor (ECF subfamily)
MVRDEAVLLQRFVATGDAGAFSEIVRRYASLVYSACIRILGDSETAADATQETFFQFLKKANTITDSIPAWLHRVATGKAVDRIRAESARRRAEGQYAEVKCRQVSKWEDLSPHVDEALDALDDPSRELLIEYFFKGRSLADIGTDKSLSHPTVSRHVKAAVNKLRGQLRKSGVAVSAVALGPLLAENTVQAAPTALLSELAKMALTGAKLTAPAAAAGGILLVTKTKVIVVAAVVGVGAVGVFTHRYFTRPAAENIPRQSFTSSVSSPPVVQPQGSIAPAEPAPGDGTQAMPQTTRPAGPASDGQVAGQLPQEPAPPQNEPPKLDLSSPEATVTSFTRLMAAGDDDAVLACFWPAGRDFEDIQEILYADPSDQSENGQFQFQMKLWLQSLDPDAEMPVLYTEPTADNGLRISWQVTLKTDFTFPEHAFSAGETTELSGELIEIDGKWLFNSLF